MVSLSIENCDTNSFCDSEKCSSPDNQDKDNFHWKHVAEESLRKLKEIREEFDDFQCGSRELEAELETQLKHYEHRVEELNTSKCKLEKNVDFYREKYEITEKQNFTQMKKVQEENIQFKMIRDEMSKYIRELEQSNDDLERSKRAAICTLEEFDNRLNNLMERNAFLENELEEKELVAAGVHNMDSEDSISNETKLSFQLRDKSDRKSYEDDTSISLDTRSVSRCSSSSHFSLESPSELEDERQACLISLLGSKMKNGPNQEKLSALNIASEQQRISALDILTDLLWKVGNIESKFSCNNLMQKTKKKNRLSSADIPITTQLVEKEMAKNTSQKMHSVSRKRKTRCINLSRLVKLSI